MTERDEAAAEVEKLTGLSREAEKGSEEHRELMVKLIRARKRLYGIQTGKRHRVWRFTRISDDSSAARERLRTLRSREALEFVI